MPSEISPASPLHRWLMAARLRTLPAAAAPVLLAIAFAFRDGQFHGPAAIVCLLIALLLQVGANLANDLFDFKKGTDQPDRLGPTRVTAAGLISPGQMQYGITFVFGLAAMLSLYLVWLRGWPVIALGLILILSALAYTGGPFPYGYYGLGEFFVLLTFGFAAVGGTYYAQTGTVTSTVLWAAIGPGLLIVNILVVNNTRDRLTDLRAGKRTLAVLLGRKAMDLEFGINLLGAYLIPILFWVTGEKSLGGLFCWLSFPYALYLFHTFIRAEGRALNPVLAQTAQLALIYSVLFALGVGFIG
ncbi:MAG: 1,4-dihydroxy-2-naphthoate polyprenyltransferase [Thermodesulfobacteriota bacterium]